MAGPHRGPHEAPLTGHEVRRESPNWPPGASGGIGLTTQPLQGDPPLSLEHLSISDTFLATLPRSPGISLWDLGIVDTLLFWGLNSCRQKEFHINNLYEEENKRANMVSIPLAFRV